MENAIKRSMLLLIVCTYTTHVNAEYPLRWDLMSSIQEAFRQAPQLQAAKAEINARKSQLDGADNWPNPRFEIAVGDNVSLEQGNDGYAVNGIWVTQPLPFFGRLDAETRQAQIALSAANSEWYYNFLEIEKNTAMFFYALQYQTDLLKLSEQRHDSLEKLLRRDKDPLVRYFTKTERKRLGILREEAHQAMAAAEGEHREAVSQFRTLLALSESHTPALNSFEPVPPPPTLEEMLSSQEKHPLLMSLEQSKLASKTGIDVARAQRRIDPELTVYSIRDVFAGREQTSTGVTLMFEVPLWQSNDRTVARARANFHQQQAELNTQQRDLANQLRKSHLHLQHLREQAQHYQQRILTPANEILQLSSRGFRSGEIQLLTFIDAHNTYYDAKKKYLQLVYEGWLETAEMRYSAGQMLSKVSP